MQNYDLSGDSGYTAPTASSPSRQAVGDSLLHGRQWKMSAPSLTVLPLAHRVPQIVHERTVRHPKDARTCCSDIERAAVDEERMAECNIARIADEHVGVVCGWHRTTLAQHALFQDALLALSRVGLVQSCARHAVRFRAKKEPRNVVHGTGREHGAPRAGWRGGQQPKAYEADIGARHAVMFVVSVDVPVEGGGDRM